MSKDSVSPLHTRSWRDIPQPVKPRAMSGGGRRRLLMAGGRIAGVACVVGAVGWGSLQVAAVLQKNPKKMPAAAKSVVVKEVVLVTDAYGVLDAPWATTTLALPKQASLMELDLMQLRDRILASGQVRTATLALKFPDTLAVTISERSPVARIMAEFGESGQKELLVARDGVVFAGAGYDPAMVKTLPWLEGFSLVRQGGVLQPIAGMAAVADLLAKAKLDAEHLYQTWEIVSLARLQSDGEMEVRTRDKTRIVFGNREDYFRQLARLDLLLDTAAKAQPGKPLGEINLAIGAQVPVGFAAAATTPAREARAGAALRPLATQPSSPATPNFQIKLNREL